eukprot:SAG31_NODE_14822_length_785_cov_3.860860_1_plen_174_part_10
METRDGTCCSMAPRLETGLLIEAPSRSGAGPGRSYVFYVTAIMRPLAKFNFCLVYRRSWSVVGDVPHVAPTPPYYATHKRERRATPHSRSRQRWWRRRRGRRTTNSSERRFDPAPYGADSNSNNGNDSEIDTMATNTPYCRPQPAPKHPPPDLGATHSESTALGWPDVRISARC